MDQIPEVDWPMGISVCAAALRQRWDEVAARGVEFFVSCDSLDCFRGAILKLEDGTVVALRDHLRAPVRVTEILVSRDLEEPEPTITKLLDALRLSQADVVWRCPDFRYVAGLERGEPPRQA